MKELLPAGWFILLNSLYWLIGAGFLRAVVGSWRKTIATLPHVFAAYPLGLVLHCVLAYLLNQFVGIELTTPLLVSTAAALALLALGVAALAARRPADQAAPDVLEQDAPRGSWTWLEALLLLLIAVIFADRHAAPLWTPLNDWDTYSYHLPLGQRVAGGTFPRDIGPSYNRQMEQAYPPLLYFVYGLAMRAVSASAWFAIPKVNLLATNLLTCIAAFALARDRFGLPRVAALMATLMTVVAMSCKVNMQASTTLLLLLTLYYAWPWPSCRNTAVLSRWFAVGGAFAAGCYWANYLGIPLIGLVLVGMIVLRLGTRFANSEAHLTARNIAIFAAVCGLLVAPHLLSNLLDAGNPIYPGLISTLGGKGVTPWFLKVRTICAPVPFTLTALPLGDFSSTPVCAIILATCAISLWDRRLPGQQRLFFWILIGGFIVAWHTVLQLSNTPTNRYLFPILPICGILLTRYAWEVGGSSWEGALPAVFCIVALFLLSFNIPHKIPLEMDVDNTLFLVSIFAVLGATAAGTYFFSRSSARQHNERGSTLRFLLLSLVLLSLKYHPKILHAWQHVHLRSHVLGAAVALLSIIAAGAALLAARPLARFRPRLARPARALVFGVPLVMMVTILARHADPAALRSSTPPLSKHVRWMNTHLPKNAVVLTLESRLFFLQRSFFPADDPRLELFYSAKEPEQALQVLRRLGITHVFYSSLDWKFAPWWNNRILTPPRSSAYLKILYEAKVNDDTDYYFVGQFLTTTSDAVGTGEKADRPDSTGPR